MVMKRSPEERLLNPVPGSRIAEAHEYGIDLTLLVENLRLSPADRIKQNDALINDLIRFENAMRSAKSFGKSKVR